MAYQTDERRPKRRELSLDLLRGLAVISMMITHAISFWHTGDDPIAQIVGQVGGTISFGLFLFVSAAAHYLSFVRLDEVDPFKLPQRRSQLVYRAISLLIGYYAVAFVTSVPLFSFPPNSGWLDIIARILFFVDVPAFAEFIIPFILFSFLLIPLRRVYKLFLTYPPLIIAVGVVLYMLGQVLIGAEATDLSASWKSLFVGHLDWHRFPLFQYFIVYAFGLVWGKFLSNYNSITTRIRISLLSLLAIGVLVVCAVVSFNYLQIPWLDAANRWPPSLTFILLGLVAAYLLSAIIFITRNLKILGSGQVWIHFLGDNPFSFFVFHTIILYIYTYISKGQRFESMIIVGLLFVGLIVVTAILSAFTRWVIQNLQAESGVSDGFGWLLSEKVIVTATWVVLILIAGTAIYQGNQAQAAYDQETVAFKKRLIKDEDWPFWWDHSYNFFQQITVASDISGALFRDTWFSVPFNHGQAVAAGQSQASGADVRVVYYDESKGFLELPFLFEGINSAANIKFQLQAEIPAGQSTDRYFIYYGNPVATSYPVAKSEPAAVLTAGATVSTVYSHKLSGSTNRKWILKEGNLSQRTVMYSVQLNQELSPESLVSYRVVGTNLRGLMDNQGGGKYQAAVKVSELPPGIYQLQASARQKDNQLKVIDSGYTNFNVTYPLYVTWTQDWEGWDVPDVWLAELDSFAQRYGIVMTHFFNPCIYSAECSAQTRAPVTTRARADQLTLWAQNRAKVFNDEIGLHLHMFPGLAVSAGVTPQYVTVPWLYGDSATYAYSKEDMKTILTWSRRMFLDNGLPAPVSYRAGGWMLKEHTLAALEETGFLIDSSGRTAGGLDIYTQKMAGFPPPWNLSPTQAPYRPNKDNMNLDAEPRMNIWEFPNNGADSIWYNEIELIRRFDLNYPNKGGVLETPQVLTYLSHPQFWAIDKYRVDKLFNYIGNYLYRDDNGPVYYTTLRDAYVYYTQNQE